MLYKYRPNGGGRQCLSKEALIARLFFTSKKVISKLDTPCIEWTGSSNVKGYGSVGWKHKVWRVHRLIWTLKVGKIPDGIEVCHKCDNKPCFNLEHLFLGTHAENMRDAAVKKLVPPQIGMENPRAKLNDGDVLKIRALDLTTIASKKDAAIRFGVSYSIIHKVWCGYSWTHLPLSEFCQKFRKAQLKLLP